MDTTIQPLNLHPHAEKFLFEYYVVVNKAFSNILAHLETDYLSITLINKNRQMFFISSNPSIQQNLIEHGAWAFHGAYQPSFINQKLPKLWSELDHAHQKDLIQTFKHSNNRMALLQVLSFQLNIPTTPQFFLLVLKKAIHLHKIKHRSIARNCKC